MPAQEQTHRYQAAVLWEHTGTHDRYGQPLISDPIEVRVRWESGRMESKDEKGQTIIYDALVHSIREIPLLSRIWLGQLGEWSGTAGPEEDVMVVVDRSVIPDLKGRVSYNQYSLQRFKGYPE